MPERLKAILDKITAWWKKFNTKQRSVLISIVAVVIVALVILGVVISRPTQVELVEAQSASEASTIKGVLEDNNISYEVDSKLVFFVNKSDEVNAIMALGDNGIPAQAYSIDNVTAGSGCKAGDCRATGCCYNIHNFSNKSGYMSHHCRKA